uniref:Uncharacterized protein n=1 Tax=Picea glauca TaxID=3330 RepID=A0A117NIV1_PICGL|nr:hypothetical protein ABT39_MTgene326 [Picea glauca]
MHVYPLPVFAPQITRKVRLSLSVSRSRTLRFLERWFLEGWATISPQYLPSILKAYP